MSEATAVSGIHGLQGSYGSPTDALKDMLITRDVRKGHVYVMSLRISAKTLHAQAPEMESQVHLLSGLLGLQVGVFFQLHKTPDSLKLSAPSPAFHHCKNMCRKNYEYLTTTTLYTSVNCSERIDVKIGPPLKSSTKNETAWLCI